MAFKPEQLPSGRFRGGFRHPATKRKITKTFDYDWEADAWAVTEENRARANMIPAVAAPAPAPTAPMIIQQPVVERWIGPTLADYGREYLDRRRGVLGAQTFNKYAAWVRALSVDVGGKTGAIGARRMGLLKRSEVEQFQTDSRAYGVTAKSINDRTGMIRRLFRDLGADDDAPTHRDPTRGLRALPEDEIDDRVLTDVEEIQLLAAAREVDPGFAIACLTALDAGLRWQEVYALRPMALFKDGAYLIVSHAVERGRTTPRPYTKGTGGGEHRKRIVPTTERLADELARLAHGKGADELLFPGPRGGLFEYHNHRNRLWNPTLYRIGLATRTLVPTGRVTKSGDPITQARYLPEFGFHALRHTYGTWLADKGVPRAEIARNMGHADERTTKRYIHATDDGRRLRTIREIPLRGAEIRALNTAA